MDINIPINTTSTLNSSGVFNINVLNTTPLKGVYFLHLNISPWLWYLPKGFGDEYNYTSSSSCLTHPCIKYEYRVGSSGYKVESGGEYKGVDIKDINVSDNKRGIRLFR